MGEAKRPDANRDRMTVFLSRSGPDDAVPAKSADDIEAVSIPLDTALKLFPDLRDVLTQPPAAPPAQAGKPGTKNRD